MQRLLRFAVSACIFAIPAAGIGCASIDPRPDYDRVDREVEAAVGHGVAYRPSDEPLVQTRVAELLADGLSASEAVQLALLNNPRVWAGLLRTGMARADVVQAGLFSNPSLGMNFLLPAGGGLTQFEMGLAQNIADLWMIPARKGAARHDLDRTVLETAREISALANDARVAYFGAVGAAQALEIARENVGLVEQLHRLTEARLEAGAIGALDANLAQGQVLRARVDERQARLAAASAMRTLATVLGLDAPAEAIVLTDPLPAPADPMLDTARMVEVALESRLDARAAGEAVSAAEQRLELERARVFQSVELGTEIQNQSRRAPPGRKLLADTARASIANGTLTPPEIESRGQRQLAQADQIGAILGPTIGLTLPLFDQNQAQIAKAELAVREAGALLESLHRAIAQETRDAADRVYTAWSITRSYAQDVLPQARATLALSQSAYEAGQTPILNVIDAQRSLLEMRQAQVSAQQAAALALVDLERATAHPAESLLQPLAPATQPSNANPITLIDAVSEDEP